MLLRSFSISSVLLLLVTTIGLSSAIYPDNHWNFATQIKDVSGFESHVKDEIDAGRTLFVRWIASAG